MDNVAVSRVRWCGLRTSEGPTKITETAERSSEVRFLATTKTAALSSLKGEFE